MKKSLIIITLLTILASSCFNPVFYNITQDVPPEKATVSGVINSIVRYEVNGKQYLVLAADKGIRYKEADSTTRTEWRTYNKLPFNLSGFDHTSSKHEGQSIIKVIADDSHLYILSTTYKIDDDLQLSVPDVVTLYSTQITSWDSNTTWHTVCSGNDYFKFTVEDDYVYSNFNAFCTNSVKTDHREAYLRCNNKYYKLDGIPPTPLTIQDEQLLAGERKDNHLNSAVYFDGKTYFFNSVAAVTNETKDTSAEYIYFGEGRTLKYADKDGTVKTAIDNCGAPISCLAPCKDALLIGRGDFSNDIDYTTGGLTKTTLTNGIPGNQLAKFSTNAHIQLSESYYILTLINTDPSKSELQSTLYASIAFVGSGSNATAGVNYDNIGLWSYYPSRGNWNRE